jgi:hypothetical protein
MKLVTVYDGTGSRLIELLIYFAKALGYPPYAKAIVSVAFLVIVIPVKGGMDVKSPVVWYTAYGLFAYFAIRSLFKYAVVVIE